MTRTQSLKTQRTESSTMVGRLVGETGDIAILHEQAPTLPDEIEVELEDGAVVQAQSLSLIGDKYRLRKCRRDCRIMVLD